MFDESVWSMLVKKCQSIYQKHGLGIEIPTDNASDPVEVFDEVQVDKNVFRFVVKKSIRCICESCVYLHV